MTANRSGWRQKGKALHPSESLSARETIALVARRTYAELSPALAGGLIPSVECAVKYMLANYPAHITLDDVSRAVGLSKCHLIFAFRKLTGMTPGSFLKRLRMVRAMDLLAASDRRVHEIANEVGYKDTAAFCRAFLSIAGTQPTEYRNRRPLSVKPH